MTKEEKVIEAENEEDVKEKGFLFQKYQQWCSQNNCKEFLFS